MSTDPKRRICFAERRQEQGFTILEVIVAISIFSFGLLAVATMQAASIRGNGYAIDLTDATARASDRLETLIRLGMTDYENADNLKDKNGNGDAGLDDVEDSADYKDVQSPYTISWNVSVDSALSDTKTVRVIVTWNSRGITRNVSMQQIIPKI